MQSIVKHSLLMTIALAVLACAGPDAGTPGATTAGVTAPSVDAEKIARIDALFAEWDEPASPGCSVGIVQDGELVFARGYGSANLDYQVPLDHHSAFYIASTSKQFAAAALARLALDGEISLDDDVRRYIPELPDLGMLITVRNLVHHTSGIRDYLTLMGMRGSSFEDFFDNDDAIALLARQRALNFEPGDEHLYSNSNYVLMAALVEQVSGQTLQEFSTEHFFGPLGMDATHWGENRTAVVPDRVVSYDRNDDGTYRRWVKNFHGKGDGNLLTTVEDLARWDAIFYSEEEPWASLVELMLTRGELNDGETLNYAFGLSHFERNGVAGISHGGGFLGFRTQLARFPSEAYAVICLCNLGSIEASRMAAQVSGIWLFDEDAPPPAEPASSEVEPWVPSEATLNAYTGSYYSPELDVIYTLTPREGAIQAHIAGADTIELQPGQEEDVFRFDRVTVTFTGAGAAPDAFVVDAPRARGIRFERR